MQGKSMTPAEIIRESKAKLKNDIREAITEYVEKTGAKLTGIDVDFQDNTTIGPPPSSQVSHISVREEI